VVVKLEATMKIRLTEIALREEEEDFRAKVIILRALGTIKQTVEVFLLLRIILQEEVELK
jgi:hypothetical protein